MSLTEFDQEEYDRNRREEGEERKAIDTARKLKARNMVLEDIADITGLPLEEVTAL